MKKNGGPGKLNRACMERGECKTWPCLNSSKQASKRKTMVTSPSPTVKAASKKVKEQIQDLEGKLTANPVNKDHSVSL